MARNELVAALRAVESALNELDSTLVTAAEGGGLGGGAGVPGAFAGGGKPVPSPEAIGKQTTAGVGSILAAARSHPVLAGLATVAAGAATAGAAQGLIAASRGGDFEAGALSGINAAIARVPFVGEISGAGPEERVKGEVRQTAAEIAEIRARGGDVSAGFEDFLLRERFQRGARREQSLQRSERQIESLLQEGILTGLGSDINDITAPRTFRRSPRRPPLFRRSAVDIEQFR